MNRERGPLAGDACLDDGELFGWIDQELEDGVRARVEDHLHRCAACSGRVRLVDERSRHVGGWLSRHDPDAPSREAYDLTPLRPPGWRRPHWAIAAGIVLAVGVAAGPARGWLLQRMGLARAPVAESVEATGVDLAAGTSFVPRSTEVTVVFDEGVDGRTLEVAQATGSVVTLTAHTAGAEVVIRPDRMEIHDAGVPGGAYRLSVPPGVSAVRVRVPGAADVVVRPGSAATVSVPRGGG